MAVGQKSVAVGVAGSGAFQYYRPLIRLKRFVEKNYHEDISLQRAARVAALERTYFSTFFRKKVGIGFRDWLRQVRVEKAMRLFEQQDNTISEVADAVGFGDLTTFERAFKRVAGMTPSEYRALVSPDAESAGNR